MRRSKSLISLSEISKGVRDLNKGGMKLFRRFLEAEYSEENLDFVEMCEVYQRETNQKKSFALAKEIYGTFVKVGSPREVNLSYMSRDIISLNMMSPDKNTFDCAVEDIYRLIEMDSFRRFLKHNSNDRNNDLLFIGARKNAAMKMCTCGA